MSKPPKESLPEARARLMSLASASRPPKIIEVLRTLRGELLQCIAAGHSASSVLAALRASGYEYSRSAFAEAWKKFRDEEGLTLPKAVIYTPKGTISRSTPAHVARPSVITAGTKAPPGSALEALARPTIAQLLATSAPSS
jgi:hypothetical protein